MSTESRPPAVPDRRELLRRIAALGLTQITLIHAGALPAAAPYHGTSHPGGSGGAAPPPLPPGTASTGGGPGPALPPTAAPGGGCGQHAEGGWLNLDSRCAVFVNGSALEDYACGKPLQLGFAQTSGDGDCSKASGPGTFHKDRCCGKVAGVSPSAAWNDAACGTPGGPSSDADCGLTASPGYVHVDSDCIHTLNDSLCVFSKDEASSEPPS